jgi:hypothetical protein
MDLFSRGFAVRVAGGERVVVGVSWKEERDKTLFVVDGSL